MSIIRWNPLADVSLWHPVHDAVAEFTKFQREFDRVFNNSFSDGKLHDESNIAWVPAVDTIEQENDFLVHVELPGVSKNDVKISVANSILTIKGEKKSEHETEHKGYRHIERSQGSFQRSFSLPKSVNSKQIEATYDNGVLTVKLPKLEEAKPVEVEVKIK